jgi:hypothetical protein
LAKTSWLAARSASHSDFLAYGFSRVRFHCPIFCPCFYLGRGYWPFNGNAPIKMREKTKRVDMAIFSSGWFLPEISPRTRHRKIVPWGRENNGSVAFPVFYLKAPRQAQEATADEFLPQ